jgi:hypothetical protein
VSSTSLAAQLPTPGTPPPATPPGESPAATVAGGASGDYVLLENGTELVGVRFQPAGGGEISGAVSLGGNSVALTGRRSGSRIEFTTTSPNGTTGRWRGTVDGDALSVTLTTPEGSERFTLVRRGLGWSDATALARRWRAALDGKAIAHSTGTNGGSHGGASNQTTVHLCPGGGALVEATSAISVYVPGMSGSQTSRASDRARWRVITRDGVAAVELTAERWAMQIGVRPGSDDTIYVADQLVRVRPSSKCN